MKKLWIVLLLLLLPALPVSAQDSYDLLYPFEGGYARAVKEQGWGLLDEQLTEAAPFSWAYIGELIENRRLVKQNEQYGFLDESNQPVIPPSYAQAGNFSEGLACVKNAEGLWGYIDAAGKPVIPCAYEEANDFSCGLALVKTGGLYGYINSENQMVIPAAYTEAYPFYENRACVRFGEHYGHIDPAGVQVIPAAYELAFDFCEGGAVVKSGGYGLIDSTGSWLIAPEWAHLSPQLKGGYLKATQNGKMAFLDSAGQLKTDFLYDYLGDFSQGLALVQTEAGYSYLNSSFQPAFDTVWEHAGDFSEGFAPVCINGQYGYIDTNGEAASDFVYSGAGRVSVGYGAVQTEAGWQFIQPQRFVSAVEAVAEGMLVLRIGDDTLRMPEGEIALEAAPLLHEGVTMLPIRQVVEAIGGTVEWEAESRKISLSYEAHSVTMTLGEAGAFVDGRFVLLEVPSMLSGSRTLVPLRFATEALGCGVKWIPQTKEILITYS